MEILRAIDRRIWQARVSSADVTDRRGVEDMETVHRREILQWFGHVERTGQDTMVGVFE